MMSKRYSAMVLALVLATMTPAMQAAEPATADEVLEAHLAAIGGKEKVLAVESMQQFGRMTVGNGSGKTLSGSLDLYLKSPNQMLLIQQLAGAGEARMGFDGSTPWSQDQTGGVRVLEGDEKESVKSLAQYDRFARYADYFPDRKLKGSETLNNRKVYRLQLSPEKGQPWNVYIDAQTYLITAITIEYTGANDARTQVHSIFTDYRTVNGLKVAYRREQRIGTLISVFQVNKVRLNLPLNSSFFSVPTAQTPKALTDE
jgi:outer membrane lipoprotein-sorting protein